ncbi:hypothetical protein P9250_08545 [Caballeronia sp. LP006]|uniref:hypothetical protein n=1 Tax=Caballeronia sp. LP006 TaxID=3038552 RepID=UPI002866D244|nr:hypothetical protein [Caballeronia sp. LP006]MDR5827920.1 hypothetical protein [Caballeronia sp. LP006]
MKHRFAAQHKSKVVVQQMPNHVPKKKASIVKLTLKNQDGHPLTEFLSKNMVLGLKTCSFWPPRFAGGFFLPEVVKAFAMETKVPRTRERTLGRQERR